MKEPRNASTYLSAIIAVALAARIAAIVAYGTDQVSFGDATDYVATAQYICERADYPERGSIPFFRAPGLPIFIAAITGCSPHSVAALKIAFALVDCLTIFVLFKLSVLVWDSDVISLMAAAGAALYPPFLFQVTDIHSEPLFMCLLMSSLFAFVKASKEPALRWFLISGALLAAASLVRPASLALLGVYALGCCVLVSSSRIRRCGYAVTMGAAFACVLMPWIVFNYAKYNEFIIVNDSVGYNFWRGASPEMAAVYDASSPEEFIELASRFEHEVSQPLAAAIAESNASPKSRSRAWFNLALASISESPAEYARFQLKKAYIFWRPWLNPAVHTPLKVAFTGLVFVLLYVLSVPGLARMFHRNTRLTWFFCGLLLVAWLIHIPFQVVTRFRVPIVDPLLIVFAAYSASVLFAKFRQPAVSS